MEQNKKAVIEKLQQMKDEARETLAREGLNLYVMHVNCAIELAEQAIALLEADDHAGTGHVAPKMDGAPYYRIQDIDENGNVVREVCAKNFIGVAISDLNIGIHHFARVKGNSETLLNLYNALLKQEQLLEKREPKLLDWKALKQFEAFFPDETEASDAEVQDGFKV